MTKRIFHRPNEQFFALCFVHNDKILSDLEILPTVHVRFILGWYYITELKKGFGEAVKPSVR